MTKQKYKQKVERNGLKIAMIGHKRIPSREGGVEIVVEELSKRLVSKGHSIHAYNRKGHHVAGSNYNTPTASRQPKEYKGIRIITVPTLQNKSFNALIYSVLATLRALFENYDCIHYHAEGPCAMLWLPHLFGIKTIATIHGLDWQRAKWGGFATKYLLFGEKMAARYADEVIVLSKNVQSYFEKVYQRKTRFIPNGINKPVKRKAEIITKKWNLNKDEYILYLGRIVPEKGLHYLIEAYKGIETDKKLVIAGGNSHSGEYMNEVKKQAEGNSKIIFTDFVQGETLEELYSNAYLYVLPSDLEGMPISLLEAMSYGNCCLVSDIPECTEVVEDKAVSFKKGNVNDLKDKLTWLLQNQDAVIQYKNNAGTFILEKYDWESVVKMTLELYRKKGKTLKSMKGKESLQ